MDALWFLIVGSAIFLLMTCTYLIVQLANSKVERKKLQLKVSALQEQIASVELKSVESKLNPHLFKNILNSIQSHAYQTYFSLDKLANVLDYILYDSRNKFVTPKEEIQFALNLIEINKIKISPLFEFKVKLKIDEREPLYEQKVMAPLISIDLIENAFKHADLQSSDSFITITFELRDGNFALIVSNKISSQQAIRKERSGIGSETMEQRLKLIYKDTFKLERLPQGDTYLAYLKINLREYQAQMHTA